MKNEGRRTTPRSLRRNQFIRAAPQRLPNPRGRGDEHIGFPRFDFPHIADVNFDEFRQPGLGHAERDPFAPDILPESSELGIFADASWHAAHRKNLGVDRKDTVWPVLARSRESRYENQNMLVARAVWGVHHSP